MIGATPAEEILVYDTVVQCSRRVRLSEAWFTLGRVAHSRVAPEFNAPKSLSPYSPSMMLSTTYDGIIWQTPCSDQRDEVRCTYQAVIPFLRSCSVDCSVSSGSAGLFRMGRGRL